MASKIKNVIEKYRQEALDDTLGNHHMHVNWREAILETIFRPYKNFKVPGKEPMSHLHPDIDKLHLPEHCYIADWRKYRVEDHPLLVNFQKKCHTAGLHDPWLRNYAYQYYPNCWGRPRSVTALATQGCLTGFMFAAIIFGAELVYKHYYPLNYQHSPKYIEKYGKSNEHHH